jgi:arginine/lysine/ornithine decarboxylase
MASNGCLHELILTRVGLMIKAGSDSKALIQEVRRLAKRYEEDSPLYDVIPDGWKTDDAKRRHAEWKLSASRPGTKRPPEDSGSGKKSTTK